MFTSVALAISTVTTASWVSAACLVVLGIAHTVLGETGILRPLFAAAWNVDTPRWAMERILRFAWHVTSIAWFAMAAIIVGAATLPVVGVMSIASALMIFVMLRGHLAWPLFLLGGLAAFQAEGWLGAPLLITAASLTVAALIAAAAVHIYWAFGGTWGLAAALPELPGTSKQFRPGPVATLAVAGALLTFAGLVIAVVTGSDPSWMRWLVGAGIAVLTIRAIGDGKVAGFTKEIRDTDFGKADDRVFTPLCVFLSLGAAAALLA